MLPLQLRPRYSANLIRLGSQSDGGYVIPLELTKDVDLVLAFGVGADWSFEKEFSRINGCRVSCYDHTVTTRFWVRRFLSVFIALLLLQRRRAVNKVLDVFRFIDYKLFFRGDHRVHHQLMIGPVSMGGVTVPQVLQHHPGEKIFLKIDIEGWEYRILKDLSDLPKNVLGMVVEFHDIDLHMDKILTFVESLKAFKVIHIHGNNFSPIDDHGNPTVIELTLVRDVYTSEVLADGEYYEYPLAEVDFPNDPRKPDSKLTFYSP